MHERADRIADRFLTVDEQLQPEFDARLVESSRLVFRVAFSVLRHREDAEDVAQEAFTKAYRSFARLRDRDRFRAWIVRMTWRLALNRRRTDQRRLAREATEEIVSTTTAADALLERERAEQLWDAIDKLPEKLRLVVVLGGIQEHDIREVALLLGLPEGTVKSRLFVARHRLKELLLR